MSARVELVATDGGRASILGVRAQPGAKKRGLAGTWNGLLKLAVGAPPEDGRANDELVELIARLFALKRNQVTLLSGASSRQKRFRLELAHPAALERLTALLSNTQETP